MTNRKDQKIQAIVEQSGNSFHCKVIQFLIEKGWRTLVSPYYTDNVTNKPREIDVIAEKHWMLNRSRAYMNPLCGAINFRLYVECKYIAQPNVFWFSEKDVNAARKWVVNKTPLRPDNYYTEKHHYLASDSKVAKLFASENRLNTEAEVVYKALNQSLNAMVYLHRRQSIIPELGEGRIDTLTSVRMPIILCNSFDNFYRVEMDAPGTPQPINDNFQLEVNYAYLDDQGNHRAEYFLIDIVDFRKLDNFLEVLEEDKKAIFTILEQAPRSLPDN